MPELAADALVMAYGDFNRAYMFVQHTELMMIRDEITDARNDIIHFTFRRRYGGDVIRAEAIKLYKAAA
jgi:HK97 family phage major capsid protein